MLSHRVQTSLIGAIALSLLLAFIVIYGIMFWSALEFAYDPTSGAPGWIENADVLSLCTGLAGLVSGIVAVALAPQPPHNQQQSGSGNTASESQENERPARFRNFLTDLFTVERGRSLLTILYAVSYTVLGLGAAAVWIIITSQGVVTPEPIKALATLALGLFIPTVRSYFLPGQDSPGPNA